MEKNINLQYYSREIKGIKAAGRELGLSAEEINFAFKESFSYLRKCQTPKIKVLILPWLNFHTLRILLLIGFVILFGLCFSYRKPAHNFIERNIQEAIYPFMKLYRRLTLPLVLMYPSLSGYYDESCLFENPYFQVSKMDCWPCKNTKFVLNLTDSRQNKAHIGFPYIIKANDSVVTLLDIKNLYFKYSEVFIKHAEKINSNNHWRSVSELFLEDWSNYKDLQISWRINRMEPARVLRYATGFPKNVPNYETSILIERYLLYDGPESPPYQIPAAEGANVFLKQLSGSRLLVLEPTPECFYTCQRLSVLLKEQHTLWYNWWYWRPRSLPITNNTKESLALLGSAV